MSDLDAIKARRQAMLDGLSWPDKIAVIVACGRKRSLEHEELLADVLKTAKSIPTARQA